VLLRGEAARGVSATERLEGAASRLDVDGLLLDMDGVLTVSWQPVPGAVEAVRTLRRAGVPLRVLTSTTALSRARLAERLRASGFAFADEEVLAAAVLAGDYLREQHPGARVFLLGDAQQDDLPGVDLVGLTDRPDVILLSGADASYCFEAFNSVLRLLLDGARLVAMHRSLVWETSEGPCLDSGAYLLGLERAARRTAVVTGKPAPGCFAAGAASLGLPPDRVGMVGDDLDNDVLAAQRAGMAGVLVRTGKFRSEALDDAATRPRHVVDSMADVPALLGL
jgi:HAD superfamily hydrolase (TIGR01458 family)